jgi:predicted GIY-YIG superfamily endonuclease
MNNSVYILFSAVPSPKHYIGSTKNIVRRLRQHLGTISGGAKSTRVRSDWIIMCSISGFDSWSETLSCERKLKSMWRSSRRIEIVPTLLSCSRWSSNPAGRRGAAQLVLRVDDRFYDRVLSAAASTPMINVNFVVRIQ